MGAYDMTVGVLLIGIFFNTYLYGFVSYQFAIYFTAGYRDPIWLKVAVATFFALDTFHSAAVIYMAWFYCVTNFDNPTGLGLMVWPYPLTSMATAAAAVITHLFLSYRIYALCKKLWVAIPLVALAIATFVTGVSCGARAAGYKYLADVEVLLRPTTAWIILSASTDILIAFILIVLLRFSRTGFQRTDTVLNRLIQSTVQTGFFAALFSTLVLVFFRVSPSTNLYGMFCIPIGRIYTNTLMGTLNQRQNLRGILSGLEFIGTTGVSGVGSTQRTDDFRFTLQNIHVRTETAREVVCDPVDDRLRRDDDSKSKPRGPDDAPFEPMP